jgi:hypothetical protein
MDFMGPFHMPGYPALFVLLVVDYATRFVQLFPARSPSATTVVRALEAVQNTYGRVQYVITDNASCFRAVAVRRVLEENQIEHIRTAVGHPQSNGLAERTIRTVTDRIGTLIAEGRTSIRAMLPQVAFSINTSASESLNETPFRLLHGFTAVLPGEPSPHPAPDARSAASLRQEAHQQLSRAQARMKSRFDRQSAPAPGFRPGDHVLVRLKQSGGGVSEKLRPRFIGPHVVVRKVATQTYEVRSPTGRLRILNARDLRLHGGTPAPG